MSDGRDMNAGTGMNDGSPPRRVIGDDERVRAELVACGQKLLSRGLLTQTSGNLSVRVGDKVYITPSSLEYDHIGPGDIAVLNLDGSVSSCRTGVSPSSETPLHCLTYEVRPDVAAIVHTHSGYATTLAVLGLPIPAVHYMIAVLGVTEVPVAPYATYGTEQLARNVRDSFTAPARAVLLANHGMVAVGHSLKHAADAAESLEHLAGLYYRALLVGKPNVLSDAQMAEVINKYRAKVPAVATAAAAAMAPMAASTSEGSAFLPGPAGGTT